MTSETRRDDAIPIRLPLPSLHVTFLLLLALQSSSISTLAFAMSGLREYCYSETFSAACADSEVIVIRSALYGRMRTGRCISSYDTGVHHPCRQSVMRQADRLCSGRRTCEIRIPEPTFDATQPCPSRLRVYLEIIPECLPVVTVPRPDCPADKHVAVRQPYGYLSSYITDERGYGTTACPYRIELPRGQRVNVTLIDFSTPNASPVDTMPSGGSGLSGGGVGPVGGPAYDPVYAVQQSNVRTCYLYATITERGSMTRNVRICGGERRERNVYTSRSNVIEIRISTRNEYFFLFFFEAIGCHDPEPPKYGWLIRDNDGVLMGCNFSDHEWRLTCDGMKWNGHYENCSSGRPQKMPFMIGNLAIPYTPMSVGILVGMASIAVIVTILIAMICIEGARSHRRQRKRSRRSSCPRSATDATMMDAATAGPSTVSELATSSRKDTNHYSGDPSKASPITPSAPYSCRSGTGSSPNSVPASFADQQSHQTNHQYQVYHQELQPSPSCEHQPQQQQPPRQGHQQRNSVHFNTKVTVVRPPAAPDSPPPGDDMILPPPPPPPPPPPVLMQSQEPEYAMSSRYLVSRDVWPMAPSPVSVSGNGPSSSPIVSAVAAGGGSLIHNQVASTNSPSAMTVASGAAVFVPPPPEFDVDMATAKAPGGGCGGPVVTNAAAISALPRRNSMLAAMSTDLIDDVICGGTGGPLGAAPDDYTHIYETPKYLRREKAATLRLTGSGGNSAAGARSQRGAHYGTLVQAAPGASGGSFDSGRLYQHPHQQQQQQQHPWNKQRNDGGGSAAQGHGPGMYASRTMPRR